ncbi:MAG: TonB-dependent receptor [Fibrobacter sp.]|nr:TonB-dependent receptor [Fibrobacter sp.]
MKLGDFLVFLTVVAFAVNVAGADNDSTAKQLDQIVITGSKTARPMSNLPTNINVVKEKQIEKLAVENVDEALKYEEGIYNKRSKGLMESMAGLVMRGFAGTDQVLILLDGQPLNNGYVGRPQYNNIPIEDIQRIEVARGPFSSLYGGNAMAGVVNLISRIPAQKALRFRGGATGGKDAGFNTNLYTGYEDVLFNGKLGVALSFSQKRDEGYVTTELFKTASPGTRGVTVDGVTPTTDRSGAERFLIGEAGLNSAENRSVGGKLWINLNERHSIKTGLSAAWYSYRNSYGRSFLTDSLGRVRDTGYVRFLYKDTMYSISSKLAPNNFLDGSGGQGSLIYTIAYNAILSDEFKFTAGGGLTNQFENWYTSVGTASTRAGGSGKISLSPNTKGNVDLQIEMKNLLPQNNVIAGVSIEATTSETKESNLNDWQNEDELDTLTYTSAGKSVSGGILINDEFTILRDRGILSNLILNAGARFDYWRTMDGMNRDYTSTKVNNHYKDHSKVAFSPRGGMTLNLNVAPVWKPTFWVSAGKAFRPPTNYDLYRTWLSSTGWITEGNPDLKPETMISIEAAMIHRLFNNRLQINLTGYQNMITDMVYTTTISDSLKIKRKENLGKVQTRGIETGLNVRPVSILQLFSNYSWTDAIVHENAVNPASVYKRVTLVPEHIVNFGFQVEKGWVMARAGTRYVSKRYSLDNNSDTLTGVYGSYDPFFTTDVRLSIKPREYISFVFTANNIFNNEYYDYYRAPGRTLGGEVVLKF